MIGTFYDANTYLYAGFGYLWPALALLPGGNLTVLLQGFCYGLSPVAQRATVVSVEARAGTSPAAAAQIMAASLVTLDAYGAGPLTFAALPDGAYYLAVMHPKGAAGASIHLPVISAVPVAVGNGSSEAYDFSAAGS